MGKNHNLEELEVKVHRLTPKAALVSTDGDEGSAVWLPLSQIELSDINQRTGLATLDIPHWLAVEKELV